MRRNKNQKLSYLVDRVCMKAVDPQSAALFHIMKNWDRIVGEDLAQFSQPIKLSKSGKFQNLVIGVYHPSLSIKVQSVENEILERIAQIIGYRMIKKLRLKHMANFTAEVKKSILEDVVKHKLDDESTLELKRQIMENDDEEMKEVLENLYKSIFG